MRRPFIAWALGLAAATMVLLVPLLHPAEAQGLPQPPRGFSPPPPPPIKPYKPVAITPPPPYGDASLDAFRQNLAAVVQRKDRAALAKLIVAKGFFWLQDKDVADPKKSAIDNLATAINLDAQDGSGWDILGNYALDPTGAELPDHKGVVCSPNAPTLDAKAFDALLETTQTDPSEWVYPVKDGIELRSAAQPNAAVVEKLGMNLVQVLVDNNQADNGQFVRIAAPSAKTGFVPMDSIAPLIVDQLCYAKEGSGWKITGYVGNGVQPN